MQEANASSIYGQNNSRPITLQIKIIKLEILQGPLECLGDIGRSMLVIPQLKTSVKSSGFNANLAGDPDRGPISAPVLDALANLVLVAVDVRTVDVRIPRLQGDSHGVAYIAFLREPSKSLSALMCHVIWGGTMCQVQGGASLHRCSARHAEPPSLECYTESSRTETMDSNWQNCRGLFVRFPGHR